MFNPDNPEVAAAQKVMLEILEEFHRVCVKNGLTYWLEGGTLLGAIRHKGFIPWDDDIDVAMPRKDYNEFCSSCAKDLKDDFFLQTPSTDPEYDICVTKIRKNGTVLVEQGETGRENYHHGIFIDIIPYDSYKSGLFLKLMRWSYLFRDKKKRYERGTLMRCLVNFYTNVLMFIPVHIVILVREYYIRHDEKFVDNPEYQYYSHKLGYTYVRDTKRRDILPVRLAEAIFEGKSFLVPANPEEYLKAYYGGSYMELPPINQRKSHAKFIKC